MDDFRYSIYAILGAILFVTGVDAYFFFVEVLSRK